MATTKSKPAAVRVKTEHHAGFLSLMKGVYAIYKTRPHVKVEIGQQNIDILHGGVHMKIGFSENPIKEVKRKFPPLKEVVHSLYWGEPKTGKIERITDAAHQKFKKKKG